MSTSGATSFDLNVTEIVEEAFERAGAEVRSGYDLRTARRSLNLLMVEWQNRGINLWTIDSGSIPLVSGTATYDLPLDTIDLLEYVIRTGSGTNQTDIHVNRIGVSKYSNIPNKLATGRPIQIYIERRTGATNPGDVVAYPRVTMYPVPDTGNYTFVYWRMRRIEDFSQGVNTGDMPFRFLPCLVSGLAYYLSMKLPQGAERLPALKAIYDEQWDLAAGEDRDRSSLFLTPGGYR